MDAAYEILNFLTENSIDDLHMLPVFNTDPYNVWGSLSQEEKDLIKTFPFKAYKIYLNREIATTQTTNIFNYNGLNDKSDAFRHAFFQAINARDVGVQVASLFGDAHESEVPLALLLEKNMDLFNNEIGYLNGFQNPDLSNSEMSNLIYTALQSGDLRYLYPLDFVSSPLYDANGDGIQDCSNCLNGIISSTSLIPTNQP